VNTVPSEIPVKITEAQRCGLMEVALDIWKQEGRRRISNKTRGPLTILHLALAIGETSAPYNEHCLTQFDKHNTTICTYFKPNISPPGGITLFEGDGSLEGFFRVLKAALEKKEGSSPNRVGEIGHRIR
jgi:hypothetical protein